MADMKETAVTANVDIGKNITELFEKLAHQIGTTADKVFPWYVKQQVLEGWLRLLTDTMAMVLGLCFLIGFYGKADWKNDGNRYSILVGVGVVISALAFAFLVFGFSGSVAQIMNPNYYALKAMTSDMAKLLGK